MRDNPGSGAKEPIMGAFALDDVAREAVAMPSQRKSLLALGAAMLAAGTSNAGLSEARKKGKSSKKRNRKRCKKDAAACKTTIQVALCPDADPALCITAQKCCDTCSVNGVMVCLITHQT
jgi:hypothetical protein